MSVTQPSAAEQAAKQALQKKVLFGLLAVLALVALWRLLPDFGGPGDTSATVQAAGGAVRAGARRGQRAEQPLPSEVVALDLDALDPQAQSYEIGRNLWTFYQPPPPPPPPPPPVVRRPPPPVVPQGPPPPVVRQPPAIDFDYLGSFGPKNRPIAVFADGDQIINALAGDVLKGKFIVTEIGLESVSIQFVEFPDASAVRLEVGR